MDFEIKFKGSYSILNVFLDFGEKIIAEPGSMISIRGDVEISTSTRGVLKALKRALLGGENFFLNTYTSKSNSVISLAPRLPGDIEVVEVKNSLLVQSTSFLAAQETIDIDTKFGGFKSFFAGEGFFLIKLNGYGQAAISSFGAIYKIELESGEKITVDTGHIVAFDETMNYSIRTFGNIKSTLLGGEGLVCDFTGPGRIYIQTRNYPDFIRWIRTVVPKQTGSK
ncbi:MAG: TIGR00266 family protein [Thermosipho sp. (in: Bacteria)]|nr:TIGR00266 family protein [Thermosipho sp. (in: thermotogales)]